MKKINLHHTPFIDWCYFGTKVLFDSVSVCCSQVSVSLANSLAKQQSEIGWTIGYIGRLPIGEWQFQCNSKLSLKLQQLADCFFFLMTRWSRKVMITAHMTALHQAWLQRSLTVSIASKPSYAAEVYTGWPKKKFTLVFFDCMYDNQLRTHLCYLWSIL